MRLSTAQNLDTNELVLTITLERRDEIGLGAGFRDALTTAEDPKDVLGILYRFARFLDGEKGFEIVEEQS